MTSKSLALLLLTLLLASVVPAYADDTELPSAPPDAPVACAPLPCAQVKVTAPYRLDFSADHGGAADANGVGTGFTYVDPPAAGTGYIASNLVVDTTGAGTLDITTTSGIAIGMTNTQDNTLGIGIDAANQVVVLDAKLGALPAMTGGYEQAGLWFGNNQDNYVKLVVQSAPSGLQIQYLVEANGAFVWEHNTGPQNIAAATIALQLKAESATRLVTGSYSVNGGPLTFLGQYPVPAGFFSLPPAVVDPTIGTATFGGIFATHRMAAAPVVFKFDSFALSSPTQQDLPKRVYLPMILR